MNVFGPVAPAAAAEHQLHPTMLLSRFMRLASSTLLRSFMMALSFCLTILQSLNVSPATVLVQSLVISPCPCGNSHIIANIKVTYNGITAILNFLECIVLDAGFNVMLLWPVHIDKPISHFFLQKQRPPDEFLSNMGFPKNAFCVHMMSSLNGKGVC